MGVDSDDQVPVRHVLKTLMAEFFFLKAASHCAALGDLKLTFYVDQVGLKPIEIHLSLLLSTGI